MSFTSLIIAILALDFLLNLKFGAYLNGDALVHMAKTRDLAENGFTLIEPAFGNVTQSSYIVTVWHTLLVNSWFFSLTIAKLTIFTSLYYFGWTVLKSMKLGKTLTSHAAEFVLIITVLSPKINTFLAPYANRLAIAWVALLIVGLMRLFNEGFKYSTAGLILGASLLVTMNHPLYSLMTACLVGLVLLAFIIFGRAYLSLNIISTVFLSGTLLAVGPAISFFTLLGARSMELTSSLYQYEYWSVFGLRAFQPTLDRFITAMTPNITLMLIGIIGYVFIVLRARPRAVKILLLAVAMFVPLFAFNPLFFSVLDLVLPSWALNRLYDVGLVSYISVPFGLLGLLLLMVRQKMFAKHLLYPSFVAVIVVFIVCFNIFGRPYRSYYPYSYATEKDYNSQIDLHNRYSGMQALLAQVPKDELVFSDLETSLVIPALSPVRVLATNPGNTNALVDIEPRIKCQDAIIENLSSRPQLSASMLKQAKINYVFVSATSGLNSAAISAKEEFYLVSGNQQYKLYRLNEASLRLEPTSVCDIK